MGSMIPPPAGQSNGTPMLHCSLMRPPRTLVSFGPYQADLRSGELWKGSIRIKLQDLPFRVLAALLRAPGELVTREELQRELWGDSTFVDFEHGLNGAVNKLRAALLDSAAKPRFVETVGRRGYRFIAPVHSPEPTPTPTPTSSEPAIAVLPFINASGDPDAEYLSDGIADSVTSSLARIQGVRVAPRNIAFRFKTQQDDPREAGRALNVNVVLTGRVSQYSGMLVVRAELTDVAAGFQLWGERYQRKMTDIFEIESDLTRDIVGSLRVTLSVEDRARLTKRYTQDSEAYQLYLRGRYHWLQRAPGSILKAAEYFEQAIAHDPKFALAFAGLADCYSLLTTYMAYAPKTGWAKAKAAAAAALVLDSGLAEAHTSWGFIQFFGEWNYAAAEAAFLEAIRMDPSYATTHVWYACLLGATKRFEEGEREIQEVLRLEPLSPQAAYLAGGGSVLQGRPEEGVRRCLTGLETDPDFPLLRLWLGIAYVSLSRLPEAIREMEHARRFMDKAPMVLGSLAHVYGLAGEREQAEAILQEMLALSENGPSDGYYIALAYYGLGDEERALEWLERAAADRGAGTIGFLAACDPRFAGLRDTPRYRAVLDQIGLP